MTRLIDHQDDGRTLFSDHGLETETTFTEADHALPELFDKRILILDDVELVGKTVAMQLQVAGFKNV